MAAADSAPPTRAPSSFVPANLSPLLVDGDVVMVCRAGLEVPAHALILGLSSPVLKPMLEQRQQQGAEPVLRLQVSRCQCHSSSKMSQHLMLRQHILASNHHGTDTWACSAMHPVVPMKRCTAAGAVQLPNVLQARTHPLQLPCAGTDGAVSFLGTASADEVPAAPFQADKTQATSVACNINAAPRHFHNFVVSNMHELCYVMLCKHA